MTCIINTTCIIVQEMAKTYTLYTLNATIWIIIVQNVNDYTVLCFIK